MHLRSNKHDDLCHIEPLRIRAGTFIILAACAVSLILVATCFASRRKRNASIGSIVSLIHSQKYNQALEVTKAALQAKPNDFRLWTLEGIVLSIKGEDQDALKAFERALSLSPDYVAALRGEVQILYQAYDKRAIPLLKRILKVDPKDTTANEMLANLEEREGNCQAAIGHFLPSGKAIWNHPGSLDAYGYCLAQTKQPKRAIPVFEQLARLLPQRIYPQYDLAVLLVETKQDDAALKVLDPLLVKHRSDPELLSLASQAYEAVHNTPKAVALLRQAIVLSPRNPNYYISFAALCLSHDSFQVGIDMINAGLQRISDNPSMYLARGLLYAKLAQYDKAKADFNTAEHLDSAQSLSSYAMDLTELQGNHPDKTISEIRTQLKSYPDSALLHYLLAKLLVDKGSSIHSKATAEAMKSAMLALRLKPDLVQARDLVAGLYMRSGRYELAVEQSRLSLRYNPTDQTAIYHLIISLRHLGKNGQNNEIQSLVKRLSYLQKTSRKKETERKRFRLVLSKHPGNPSGRNRNPGQ